MWQSQRVTNEKNGKIGKKRDCWQFTGAQTTSWQALEMASSPLCSIRPKDFQSGPALFRIYTTMKACTCHGKNCSQE